jgi:hypothetical protein
VTKIDRDRSQGIFVVGVPGYLDVLAQLEGALRLLADNCSLAVQGLADIVTYLGDTGASRSKLPVRPRGTAGLAQGPRHRRRSRRQPPAGRPRHAQGRLPPSF